jgi:hypothetical protein
VLDIKTYWRPFFIDDTSKIYIDGAADTIDRFGSNDIYDIKTYWHLFFIDDASNIYIDDATDTIDHFGCNAICVKSGEGLTISGTDREAARYYKSFSSAISVFARDAKATRLQKSGTIRTSEFVWKKCEVVKKETLLNSLLMRSQASFDRFIKEHMQTIEMPFKRIYKPFAENTALRDAKMANTVKHNQDAIASSENFSRLARFAREFSEPMTVAEDYRRLVDLFKRENEISIRSIRIKQTPCGVLSDIVVNNHAITLDEFNRLANKASGYNSFTEFKVGEYEYQDALYRLAVRKKNSASNLLVYDYTIHVDIDDVKDRGTADIPAEETKVYFNRTYYTTPDVVVIVCGGTEGSVVIPSITGQGEDNRGKYFKIILKDATGKVVAGRISWNSNGY